MYEFLRRLAHEKMSHEPAGHTLQTTALVHEPYMSSESAELMGITATTVKLGWTHARDWLKHSIAAESDR